MAAMSERRNHRPRGIFDVRDHFLEHQRDDGLAANVTEQVRFAIQAVVTPTGRVEPKDWALDTRRTLSGLSVFLDRVVEEDGPRVLRTLDPAATSVELRVRSPRFQAADVAFQPATGQRVQIDLTPAVDYPFDNIATRPDEARPTLLRGSVREETELGVPDARVAVPEGLYEYRTERDGSWVIVLPDSAPWVPIADLGEGLAVTVRVTLTPTATWQTAGVLPDPGGGASPWTASGLVMSCAVTAGRGSTVSVPELRLRLT